MKATVRTAASTLLHRFTPLIEVMAERLLERGVEPQSAVVTLLGVKDDLGGALAEVATGGRPLVADEAFVVGGHPERIELVLTLQFAGYPRAAHALQTTEGLAVVVVDAGYAEVFGFAKSVAN